MSCKIQEYLCPLMGLAPAEEREMHPALLGEGGGVCYMLCEGQATLLHVHLSLSLSVGLATSTPIRGPHAGSAPLDRPPTSPHPPLFVVSLLPPAQPQLKEQEVRLK